MAARTDPKQFGNLVTPFLALSKRYVLPALRSPNVVYRDEVREHTCGELACTELIYPELVEGVEVSNPVEGSVPVLSLSKESNGSNHLW
jgi:hypothetical protein